MTLTLAILLAGQTAAVSAPPPSQAAPAPAQAIEVQADEPAPASPEEAIQRSSVAGDIVVTARRRAESVQNVPIPISVVGVKELDSTGSFNVARLQQLQPTLQFYSTNPRNSSVNIRGLGAPLGLTNDGIDQGVGVYIDQVYLSRVAVATLDFLDVQQIETLRGPQGTLYGKNTVAGAINITSKPPSFAFDGRAEVTLGNLEFKQAKASVSGPLTDDVAIRIGLTTTGRRGTVRNVATSQYVNGQDNVGFRTALLWNASPDLNVTLSGDYSRQNPVCCAQIFVRVGATQRPLDRQFDALARALGYEPPSRDAFDRVTDLDASLNARNILGGLSLRGEYKLGSGTLTSVTAWRFWDWLPANDRDFTGLPITTLSQNPTRQDQYTQEFRYAGGGAKLDYVLGLFGFYQDIHTTGTQRQGGESLAHQSVEPAGQRSVRPRRPDRGERHPPEELFGGGIRQAELEDRRPLHAVAGGAAQLRRQGRQLRQHRSRRARHPRPRHRRHGAAGGTARRDPAAGVQRRGVSRVERHLRPYRVVQAGARRAAVRHLCPHLQIGRPQPQRRTGGQWRGADATRADRAGKGRPFRTGREIAILGSQGDAQRHRLLDRARLG